MTEIEKKAYSLGLRDFVAWSMNLRQVSNPYSPYSKEWMAYEEGWNRGEVDARLEYELYGDE